MRNLVIMVVVLALATGAWFTIGPGAGAPTGACAPASSVPVATALADATTDPPVVRWTAGDLPDDEERIVRDVAAFDGGFVAVGHESTGAGSHAFVLRSTDGVSWQGRPDDEVRFADAAFRALVAVGDRLFALGSVSADDRGGSRAAVWISGDGSTWREASGPFIDASVSWLAAGTDGMLLIGSSNADGVLRAWRSESGESWEVAALELPVLRNVVQLGPVTATGDGWLSVGSISRGADSRAAPVVWRSDDGVTWSCQVLDAGGFPVAQAHELHRSGSGWLAVGDAGQLCGFGGSCPGHSIAWASADGLAWSAAMTRGEPIALGGTAYAGSDAGFVAVDGAAWLSADGASWVRLPDGGTSGVIAAQADALVLTDDGRIVAAGTSWIAVGDLSP